jgi:hypothetical protein
MAGENKGIGGTLEEPREGIGGGTLEEPWEVIEGGVGQGTENADEGEKEEGAVWECEKWEDGEIF